MWNDLREHIGTIVALLAGMVALCMALAGVIWGFLQTDLKAFPKWLKEQNDEGGVVTHKEFRKELENRAIGMTETDHEIICGKVTIMVMARVDQSEKHQKELMIAFGEKFAALLEGQEKLINRLAEIQDVVLAKLNSMPQR